MGRKFRGSDLVSSCFSPQEIGYAYAQEISLPGFLTLAPTPVRPATIHTQSEEKIRLSPGVCVLRQKGWSESHPMMPPRGGGWDDEEAGTR